MPSKMEKIEKKVFRLSSHERALIAEHLISSLDEEEGPEAKMLWIEEAENLYKKYKEGKVKQNLQRWSLKRLAQN